MKPTTDPKNEPRLPAAIPVEHDLIPVEATLDLAEWFEVQLQDLERRWSHFTTRQSLFSDIAKSRS